MRDYFIRRLLLIIPTLLGATLAVFFITRIVPGGPLEARMRQAMAMASERSMKDAGGSLSEEQKEQLAAYYGFDKPFFAAYLIWLGAAPQEVEKQYIKFEEGQNETKVTLKSLLPRAQWTATNAFKVSEATVDRKGALTGPDVVGWKTKAEPEKQRVTVFRTKFNGLLQGNLGVSTRYNDRVWDMIKERMPVSIFYGLITFILTYAVCIPLGVIKAIKHRTVLDNATSVVIFVGYAVPGFVLGSLLVVYLAARMGWFPTGGFVGENFNQLSLPGKVWDLVHHAVLPLICYMVGGFAFMTMLVKNNLMDNLAADYVRTAIAKGATFRGAVLGHALRNSLIPLATTLGQVVTVFVGGSILIERIFDINGFGMLSIQAITDRDYPLVMGVLVVSAFLTLLGNILSDFFVALADPRIRFR
ncbi:ABC transporter permease [Verrucomicrobium sp. BvORR106]|uniref:ABC transporter permease n=1 Tax=Verrucomicrobium sp. BvORR106 TaxID=1403819 RepID=UPI00056E44F0|nr:ABC transporter permease [Verrucomicrobium sp. BvORR106]